MTMKAFVMKEIGAVAMMEKPMPTAGPNDAIVKTTAALICTDLEVCATRKSADPAAAQDALAVVEHDRLPR